MKTKVKPIYTFAEITRTDDAERVVEAYAFVNPACGDGWNLKRTTMEAATPDYMKWANIREMHNKSSAAGIAETAIWDDKGCLMRLKVVDDAAWEKVKTGVYKGLSVGVLPQVVRGKDVDQAVWFETSLVDRPADPDARILVARAEGFTDESATQEFEAEELPALHVISVEIGGAVPPERLAELQRGAQEWVAAQIMGQPVPPNPAPPAPITPPDPMGDILARMEAQDQTIAGLQAALAEANQPEAIERRQAEKITALEGEIKRLSNQPVRFQPVRFTETAGAIQRQIGEIETDAAGQEAQKITGRLAEIKTEALSPDTTEARRMELATEMNLLNQRLRSLS